MADPYVKTKVVGYSKKPGVMRYLKWLYFLFILLLFSALGWLVAKRFEQNPLSKIESYINNKKLEKAAVLNYEQLKKHPEHRLALLMNGAVINFGLREMNIMDTKLPFFEYEDYLEREDKSGIFIRQGFLRKFSLFPNSVFFPEEYCNYLTKYSESLKNPETVLVISSALKSKVKWKKVSPACMANIFKKSDYFDSLFTTVTGNNLSIRQKPDIGGKFIKKLKAKDKVLVKEVGIEDIVGNKRAHWVYIFTEDQTYGWVFGAYLKLKEASIVPKE